MRTFQDDFYDEVGRVFGMQRFGPQLSRMSRREWKTLQHQMKVEGLGGLADENEQLKARVAHL